MQFDKEKRVRKLNVADNGRANKETLVVRQFKIDKL